MSFEVEYFTLTSTDSSNRYVSLEGTPTDNSNVAMDLCGGTAQLLKAGNGDFGVRLDGTVTRIVWDSSTYTLYTNSDTTAGMYIGDKVRIIYDRS